MGVYRRSIPFTASNTAASTIAVTRVETTGLVLPLAIVSNIIWFQSVTTSAFNRLGRTTAMTNSSTAIWSTAERPGVLIRLLRITILLGSFTSVFVVSIGKLLYRKAWVSK